MKQSNKNNHVHRMPKLLLYTTTPPFSSFLLPFLTFLSKQTNNIASLHPFHSIPLSNQIHASFSSSSFVHLSVMAKKRKSIATTLDEVDRTMYASFCSAANSLSQLHMHALNHQKLSFQAGQRHSLEKLYQWIWRQQEGGSRVATVDILNYIQNELDYFGEEQSVSPRAPPQNQQLQPVMHVASSGFPVTSGSCQTAMGQGLRSEHCDNQSKSFEFSNALSNPAHRSLQHHQIGEGGSYLSGPSMGNGNLNTESSFLHQQSRDSTAFSSNDSAMDMHAD